MNKNKQVKYHFKILSQSVSKNYFMTQLNSSWMYPVSSMLNLHRPEMPTPSNGKEEYLEKLMGQASDGTSKIK